MWIIFLVSILVKHSGAWSHSLIVMYMYIVVDTYS